MFEQKKFLSGQNFPFLVRISRRAKRMRIAVYCDSSVVITLPFGFNAGLAEKYFKQKLNWVKENLEYFKRYKNHSIVTTSRVEYLKSRPQALGLAKTKVEQWNKIYGFAYNRINIKNQKTRWGSCSKKGNLNFNYKIVDLPEELLDYLIVHELCHLKEFNHSRNFWACVAQAQPNYKNSRQKLRSFRRA